jgi:hypothetical protein
VGGTHLPHGVASGSGGRAGVEGLPAAAELLKTTLPIPVVSLLFIAIALAILFHEIRKKR